MNLPLTLVGILLSASTFSQADGSELTEQTSQPNTITIQHRTSVDYTPDEIDVNITLLEYVKTDPENQQTSTVEIEQVEKQLLEKLKPYGIKAHDLILTSISDQSANTTNNMYGVAPLYTNTQKRLLRKTLTFEWNKPADELESFMESMRFTGIQSIFINSNLSNEKREELNNQLLNQAMKESKEQASRICESSNQELGDVSKVNINPIGLGGVYSSSVEAYPYYNNYNNYYGSNNSKLNTGELSMSISITYETIEK